MTWLLVLGGAGLLYLLTRSSSAAASSAAASDAVSTMLSASSPSYIIEAAMKKTADFIEDASVTTWQDPVDVTSSSSKATDSQRLGYLQYNLNVANGACSNVFSGITVGTSGSYYTVTSASGGVLLTGTLDEVAASVLAGMIAAGSSCPNALSRAMELQQYFPAAYAKAEATIGRTSVSGFGRFSSRNGLGRYV